MVLALQRFTGERAHSHQPCRDSQESTLPAVQGLERRNSLPKNSFLTGEDRLGLNRIEIRDRHRDVQEVLP